MSLNQAARSVLQYFPAAVTGVPDFLGNHGGFSGARLWKVAGMGGPLCLRRWPAAVSGSRLEVIHAHMMLVAARGLEFVPHVWRTRTGSTWVDWEGHVWDLTTWLSGSADFQRQPSQVRLENACTALARLHAAWFQPAENQPCPAIGRRQKRHQQWQALLQTGWRPVSVGGPFAVVDRLALRAWRLLPPLMQRVPEQLRPWLDRPLAVQPCLCDVWHDHILYAGDAVCGVIDYGAVRPDHVAVDLARMLGSLIGDERDLFAAGMAAYRKVRPLTADEEELVRVLDVTGTLLGTSNWLIWLYHDGRMFEDPAAVARRLGALVERVERWAGA